MWQLACEESWAPKNWCFWTVVLEKTLESPLDCKIKSVNPEVNQSWMFIGNTDVRKDTDVGKDWRQEKGMTEDVMVGWHHWLDGHGFEGLRSWWWTGRPGVLRLMGPQRVGQDWVTELKWRQKLKTIMKHIVKVLFYWVIKNAKLTCKTIFWITDIHIF